MGSNSVSPKAPIDALPQALTGLGNWMAANPRARTIVLKSAVGSLIEVEAFEGSREVAQTAGHTTRMAVINMAIKIQGIEMVGSDDGR